MSFASQLLAILAADTGGVLTTQLQTFDASVNAAPSIEGAVAAGAQFETGILTGLPSLEGSLIKDVTNLLVTKAVADIASLQQQAASPAAQAAVPPATKP
jgi:hypothetical protein